MSSRLWTPTFVGLSLANLCSAMIFYLLVPTMATYAAQAYGTGPAVGGALASVFFIGALLARLVAGRLVERVGPRRLSLLVAAGYLVTTAGYLVAPGLLATFAVRIANGFCFGLFGSALASAAMLIVPVTRRGEGAGWFGTGLSLAIGLGPFLGIWLASGPGGMRAVCYTATAAAALGLLILMLIGPGLPGPSQATGSHGWRTLLEARVLGLGVVMLLGGLVNSVLIAFLDPATRGTGLASAASWFFLVYAVVALVWRPVGGLLQDRFGERAVLAPCLLALAGSLALLAVPLFLRDSLRTQRNPGPAGVGRACPPAVADREILPDEQE